MRLHCRIESPPSASDGFLMISKAGRRIGTSELMVESPDARTTPAQLPRKFGAHMSIAGGCDRAVWAAHAVSFKTVQLFTKNNNQWNAPPLSDRAGRGVSTGPRPRPGFVDPVAHTSYLINLGSPDDALWQKSIDAMTVEVERCGLLGIARPGRSSRLAHGRGRGSRPRADRPGARRSSPPHART